VWQWQPAAMCGNIHVHLPRSLCLSAAGQCTPAKNVKMHRAIFCRRRRRSNAPRRCIYHQRASGLMRTFADCRCIICVAVLG